jgi:oligosaccharide repeat unit polymerase
MRKQVLTMLSLAFGFISTIVYFFIVADKTNEYPGAIITLCICNLLMFFCLALIVSKRTSYLFEPIIFTFFLYYMIFVYNPINNIASGNIYQGGVNTMGGCVKATLIFILSFSSLLLGYYFNQPRVLSLDEIDYDSDDDYYNFMNLRVFSWIMWAVGIGFFLLYNISVGRNPLYMLSFGMLNRGLRDVESFSVDFFSSLVYLAFYPMMNILIYEKSKVLKFLVLYITCVPLATRGFRNVVVIALFAPLVYYYVKRRRTPSLRASVICIFIFFFLFGFLASTRTSLRLGNGLDMSRYEFSDGLEGMLNYFNSYRVFYGAVEQYPLHYSYTFGSQLSYFFIMFIPRFLWPGKPAPAIVEAIGNSTSSISAASGAAWPNIGEYYTDFGILGSILCMFILGVLLKHMKGLYNSRRSTRASLMLYSLYLPALVAIIAYGYTAGNAPKFLFMAIPYWIQKKLCRTSR